MKHPFVERIVAEAKGEVDVRYVGRIVKRPKKGARASGVAASTATAAATAAPWYRTRVRPLQPGLSVGHFDVTAGTLGAFAKKKNDKAVYVLSNNHVLANEDEGTAADAVVQAGRLDGGKVSQDKIGGLTAGWVRLKKKSPNRVDCALCELDAGIEYDAAVLRDVGGSPSTRLVGMSPPEVLDEGIAVHKVGRTTGATAGRVTAFELDHVVVQYTAGNMRFDGQIEIEGAGDAPFSDGGDSGSLIVDLQFRALGLLFAGGETGGSNGLGLTYANPIEAVLTALKAELLY
jgi:hypothetical protein